MTAEEPLYLDAVNDRGVGVGVGFSRNEDRFVHTIYGVGSSGAEPILTSVESVELGGWPISPPWQEIRPLENRFGSKLLMLVGAAAGGHWSASLLRHCFDDGSGFLEFDIAIRLQTFPPQVSFAYQTVSEAKWADFPDGLAFASREPHMLTIMSPLTMNSDRSPVANLLQISTPVEKPERRIFQPTLAMPKSYPATLRWRYRIGVFDR